MGEISGAVVLGVLPRNNVFHMEEEFGKLLRKVAVFAKAGGTLTDEFAESRVPSGSLRML